MKTSLLVFLIILVLILVGYGCGKTDYRQGQALYTQHCANCHYDTGEGLGILIPPLRQSDWLRDHQSELACLIRQGYEGPIVVNDTTYNQVMPGNIDLSEFQITNIINYINHAWGNDYGVAKLEDIRRQLEACP